MMTEHDRKQLAKVHEQIRGFGPDPELSDVIAGALVVAFYTGQIASMRDTADKATELAEANARDVHPFKRQWADGYVEGGNMLLVSMLEEIEKLNGLVKEASSLTDMARKIRHPQD